MTDVLYAALGGSNPTSDLYTVDPVTGLMTSVGPIGFAVTGLAFDPTTGILYGSTSRQSALHPQALITIDPTTGAGTLVADYDLNTTASDLAFDAAGQLWGWDANFARQVMKIDKVTGVLTQLTTGSLDIAGGLDFDAGGVLWHIGGSRGESRTVDTTTGVPTTVATLSDPTQLQAGKFDQAGVFWGAQQFSSSVSKLVTVDPNTGTVAVVSTFSIGKVDALAWSSAPAPPGGCSLTVAPTTLTIPRTSAANIVVTSALLGGPDSTVTLSAPGAPAGITVTFAPNPIDEDGGSARALIEVGPAVSLGAHAFSIRGTDGTGHICTKAVTVTVTAAPVVATAPTMRDFAVTPAVKWPGFSTPGSSQFVDVILPTYVVGDVVVIHLHVNSGSVDPPATPAGWALRSAWVPAGSGGSLLTGTFTRTMTGTEGTAVRVFGQSIIQNPWAFQAVASSWRNVTSVTLASSNSSGAGSVSATWTLGPLTGGFTTASFTNTAAWGGQYLRLMNGASYVDIGTLTMQSQHGDGKDITTAFASDYDALDSSQIVLPFADFRLILARDAHAVSTGPGFVVAETIPF